MLAWPEIQYRLDSECGKRVAGPSEDESSAGAGAGFEGGSSGGPLWHRTAGTIAIHPIIRKENANGNLDGE